MVIATLEDAFACPIITFFLIVQHMDVSTILNHCFYYITSLFFEFLVTKLLITSGVNSVMTSYVSQSEVLELTSNNGSQCPNWIDMNFKGSTGGLLDKPLICGGIFLDNSTSDWCFSIINQDSKNVTKMLVKRAFATSIVLNEDTLWISGGFDEDNGLIHASSEFIHLDNTILGPELPRPSHRHAMVMIASDLTMVVGGLSSNGTNGSNRTYYFDHNAQTWTDGPILLIGRHAHAASAIIDVVTKETIVIVTGGFSNQSLDSTEILLDEKWTRGK